MCSIWLVVLVAANRYWAVCRPHASASVWTTRRTVGYVVVVVVSVIAFNVPRMVEYRIDVVAVAPSTSFVLNTTVSSPANATTHPADYYYYSTPHIETESRNDSETVSVKWTLREARTAFGMSSFYRYVYKVLFVNILLVLLPLVTLIVLSVFVIRALRQMPSYQLSLLHARPRVPEKPALPSHAPADDAPAAAVAHCSTDQVVKVDVVMVDDDDNGQLPQQQRTTMTMNGQHDARDEHVKAARSRSKFSLKHLTVRLQTTPLIHYRN